ncbi:MAG: flagellar biosynthetic protein FliQ [Bryobacteraceae bacterium]
MNEQIAIDLIRQALITAMWIALPLLIVVFSLGIVMSLLQTLLSIQDPSFAAVPRLAAILLTFLFALPWMAGHVVAYTKNLISHLSQYAR